jgi:hypothetical protein
MKTRTSLTLALLSLLLLNGCKKVTGLCARGGFEVDMSWDDGHLTQAVILSKSGHPCRVVCGDKSWEFNTKAGKSYLLTLASAVELRNVNQMGMHMKKSIHSLI